MPSGTILVVDDNEAMRLAVSDLLTDAGHAVHEAASGAEAIEYLRAHRPDLVLLDLVMPVVNGWAVLEDLCARESAPPVILVSGMDEATGPGHLRHAVVGWLQKPYPLTHLLRMCEAVLAARALIPAAGTRRRDRRVFVTDVRLESEHGTSRSTATLVDISAGGFRVELPFGDEAAGVRAGQRVGITFRLPGETHDIEIAGQVRWRDNASIGVEIKEAGSEYAAVLDDLLNA